MAEDLTDILGEDDMFLLEDAEMMSNISDSQLESVQLLGNRLLKLNKQAEQVEEVLSKIKEATRLISDDLLPKQMMKVGTMAFTLLTGEEIKMETIVAANMPKADDEAFPKAVGWLERNDLGDIVKKDVIAKFGRGEQEMAERVMAAIIKETNGETPVELKESVNYMTLNATLKARMKKGEELPTIDDGFTIYQGPRAKVVMPKGSKKK